MIQEIAPHRYDNHYEPLSPSPDDRVFLFSPPKMLAREGEGREIRFPRLKDFAGPTRRCGRPSWPGCRGS